MLYCKILAIVGPAVIDPNTYVCGSSCYFRKTPWLSLHKEETGDKFLLKLCA